MRFSRFQINGRVLNFLMSTGAKRDVNSEWANQILVRLAGIWCCVVTKWSITGLLLLTGSLSSTPKTVYW